MFLLPFVGVEQHQTHHQARHKRGVSAEGDHVLALEEFDEMQEAGNSTPEQKQGNGDGCDNGRQGGWQSAAGGKDAGSQR